MRAAWRLLRDAVVAFSVTTGLLAWGRHIARWRKRRGGIFHHVERGAGIFFACDGTGVVGRGGWGRWECWQGHKYLDNVVRTM